MVAQVREGMGALARRVDLPVLTQEMRIRQRGAKPFVVMFVYVAVLSIVALTTLNVTVGSASYSGSSASNANLARQGRDLFTVLCIAQLVMISLIVPAYSAGAVSNEKERGTLDLLALTLLSSNAVVAQKLAAAIGQAVMLTVASLPVVAIVFLIGGVSPWEMVVANALLFVTTAAFGALGLLCSCQFRNTKAATFASYLTVLGFLVGLPYFGEMLKRLIRSGDLGSAFAPTFALMFAFVAAASAVPLYVIASALLKRRSTHWHSRTFRMLVYGASLAVIALVLESPILADPLVNGLLYYNGQMFLPTLVNPFVAMSLLMFSGYPSRAGMQSWSVGGTLVFGVAAVFLFRHISTLRFEAMRRT